MDWLIIPGALVSAIGLIGLVLSAVKVVLAKKQGLEEDALRAQLEKVMVLNMGALFLSVIGLIMVVIGTFL